MDDTHAKRDSDDAGPTTGTGPPGVDLTAAEALAALDPADAPEIAEALAAELADDLEAAGTPAADPVRLAVDGEDPSNAAER
jgi:hypothetical protein